MQAGNPFSEPRFRGPVYPYETPVQWFLASRYGHILQALEAIPHARDSVLQERATSLRRWDRVRTVVLVFLYLGFAGTAVALLGNFVPAVAKATPMLTALIRYVGAFTGLLTLAYLLLTRLLGQIEADILLLLASNGRK